MIPDKAFYTVSYRMPYLFLPGIRMRSGKNCRSHNRQSESGKSEIEEKERRERMQE